MYKKVILNLLLINLYCITNSSPANIPDISLTIFNKSIELDATSIANLIEDEAGSDDVFEKKVFWLNNDPLSDDDLRILQQQQWTRTTYQYRDHDIIIYLYKDYHIVYID